MSIEPICIGIAILGIGIVAIPFNAKITQDERERKEKEEREKIIRDNIKRKRMEKLREDSRKIRKIEYINKFIDEIQDLSYYEAKQLQKKLGNIYVEWNDE